MLYTIVAVLVLVLDQAVKFWTVNNIMPQAIGDECVTLIPGVLHMTNVQNNGAAFSILADQRWLLVAVSALFIIGIIVLISMDIIHTKFGRWTAVLVMAGALGNCIDRVLYGYVVDMFEFELFSFAVFNIADIFITVCGILFCIHVIIYREPIEEYNAVPHKQRPVKQKAVKQKSVRQRPAKRLRRADREDEELDLELEDAGSYEDEEEDEEDEPRPARRAARTKEPARAKKKDKPDPYANIPKRGVHRPLEEEIRPQNPDDPFAEWGFGPDAEPAVRRAPAPAKEEKPAEKAAAAPAPRKGRVAPTQADEQPPEAGVPEERPARREDAPAPAKKPEPAKKPQDELDAGFGDYSLEDILSEFRDS